MSNFQSVRGGVGYNDTTSDADSKRRQQLAQIMLQQSNAAPAVGWTGALNKILAGGIAGYQMGKDAEEQTARGHARNATLADAMRAGQGQAAETKTYGDGTTINWDERKSDPAMMASILASNPDTAGAGFQMQTNQIDAKAKGEAAAAAALLEHNRAIERDRMKPIDISDGKQWFVPDLPGQAPAPMARPAPAPQPDPSTEPVAATAPPIPLAPTSGSGPMGPKSNNPGNIRTSDGNAWQGKTTQPGSQFEAFDTPENGIRAMGVLLGNYAKQGVNTLGGIVGKWAPPNENQTDALITNASKRTGFDPNQPLDLNDPAVRTKVVQALLLQEQGKMPYGQDVVQAGVDASLNRTAQTAPPPPVQASDQASLGRPAGAPGAVPAGVPAPGPQRTTVGGMAGTVVGGQGGPEFRPMAPDEKARYGLPENTSAQIDRKGNIKVLQKGDGGDAGTKVPPGYRQNADGSLTADPAYVETETRLRQAGQAPAQETKLRSGLGELQARTVEDWKSASSAARTTKASIDQMTGALDTGLKTGWGAEGKKAAATFMQGVGLPADVTNIFFNTAEGKQFETASNQLVLGMVKGLGPNPSNADREFIERTVPTMRDDPNAVRRVADFVRQKAQESIDRFKFGYAHYKDGGDPLEFDDLWAGRQTRTANGKTYYQIGGQVYEAGN
jgi:hypothetical protein